MRQNPSDPPRQPWLRGAARGVVGAMAMTGMRQLAVGLGVVRQTPPEAILHEQAPRILNSVPRDRQQAVVELAHWGYGAAAGVLFGLLPAKVRRSRLSGPVYGVLSWGAFELAVAPVLGLSHARQSRPSDRVVLFLDHLLFGMVVGTPPEAVVAGPAGEFYDGEKGERGEAERDTGEPIDPARHRVGAGRG